MYRILMKLSSHLIHVLPPSHCQSPLFFAQAPLQIKNKNKKQAKTEETKIVLKRFWQEI